MIGENSRERIYRSAHDPYAIAYHISQRENYTSSHFSLRRVLASLPSTCSVEEVLDSRITMRCAPGRSDSAPSSTLARQTARPGDYDNYEKPNGAAQVHIPRTMPAPRHDGISLGDDTARVARRVLAGAHVASEGRCTLPPEVIPPAKLPGGSRAWIRLNLRSRVIVSAWTYEV